MGPRKYGVRIIVTIIFLILLLFFVLANNTFSMAKRAMVPAHTVDQPHSDIVSLHPGICPNNDMLNLNDYNFTQHGAEPSKNNRTDYNILFLTPFSDTLVKFKHYFELLCSLTYPHDRISVAFGQDSGSKKTKEAIEIISQYRKSFRNVNFYVLDINTKSQVRRKYRHNIQDQPLRRSHMAISRNELMFRSIQYEDDWVIWLDVDLDYIPPNLIQLLLSANQPIVTPACVQNIAFEAYDRNIWRETNESRKHIQEQKKINGENFLMLELYANTTRTRLVDLRDEGKVVPIDGVGCCALMVKASCHRQGLQFPSFVFDSHIESEGMAKMAAKMGIPVYGMPYVQVFHDMKHIYDEEV